MAIHSTVKSVLNKTKRRDPWFLDDYTVNPYSGCSFNCWYCYIRGSKYGIHMEQKLAIKENAPEVLEKQLANRARKNQYGIIVLASATEPYLQVEKEIGLTRKFLELILKYRFPVHIITKSDLVVRDFDLLKEIDRAAILPPDLDNKLDNKVFVTFSFSTLDDKIGKLFETGATSPSLRLETLRRTVQEGFHAGVSLMPLLPYFSDQQEHVDHFFKTFHHAGAHYIFPASLTLFGTAPSDSKTLYMGLLKKNFPELVTAYEKIYSHGFSPTYGYQQELKNKVEAARKKFPILSTILQHGNT